MGTGASITKFLLSGGKLLFGFIVLVGLGVPFLTGLGLGLLVYLLNIVSSLLLTLMSNPIGLFIIGVIAWLFIGRWQRRHTKTEGEPHIIEGEVVE